MENCVILELKAVEKLLPLHTAQMITYLKLSGRSVGLIINFNVPHLKQGIKHVANEYRVPVVKELHSLPMPISASGLVSHERDDDVS